MSKGHVLEGAIKLLMIEDRFWKRPKAIFDHNGTEYKMRLCDFNALLPKMKDGVVEGNWITGTGSASSIIRPYEPRKRIDSNVYFSKDGRQLLRRQSYSWADGSPKYKVPRKSFWATLSFSNIERRTYNCYARFNMEASEAKRLWGLEQHLSFIMSSEDFEKLAKKEKISSVTGLWDFKHHGGGTTTLFCEEVQDV